MPPYCVLNVKYLPKYRLHIYTIQINITLLNEYCSVDLHHGDMAFFKTLIYLYPTHFQRRFENFLVGEFTVILTRFTRQATYYNAMHFIEVVVSTARAKHT